MRGHFLDFHFEVLFCANFICLYFAWVSDIPVIARPIVIYEISPQIASGPYFSSSCQSISLGASIIPPVYRKSLGPPPVILIITPSFSKPPWAWQLSLHPGFPVHSVPFASIWPFRRAPLPSLPLPFPFALEHGARSRLSIAAVL